MPHMKSGSEPEHSTDLDTKAMKIRILKPGQTMNKVYTQKTEDIFDAI